MEQETVLSKDIYMEDIQSIGLEVLQLIEARLAEYDIRLEKGQDDELYVPIIETLDRITKCPDYRSHN